MLFIARLVEWCGGFLLVALTAAAVMPEPDQPFLKLLVDFIQERRGGLMVTTAACILTSRVAQHFLERSVRNRKFIRAILDAVHEEYYPEVDRALKYRHRVTLFRCNRLWRNLFRHPYLVVYVRHGPHPRSRTVFRVDDHEGACEGIAGRIWYIDGEFTKPNLGPWSEDPAQQQQYAAAGFLSAEKARTLNVKARACTGSTVRVRGEKWGVLLLDSVTTGQMSEQKEPIVRRYAALLGKALE